MNSGDKRTGISVSSDKVTARSLQCNTEGSAISKDELNYDAANDGFEITQ